MVEWSREYYIDPATTGLNTVRIIPAEAEEEVAVEHGEGRDEYPPFDVQHARVGSVLLRPGGTGEGGGCANDLVHQSVEHISLLNSTPSYRTLLLSVYNRTHSS